MEVHVAGQRRSEGRNVSMYERQWKIVDGYAASLGLGTSPALRAIVEQWERQRGRMVILGNKEENESSPVAQETVQEA